MSVLVDVTNPVIINATTAITRESPSHLRRVCLVSLGWTLLEEGEYKEVFKYDYQKTIKPYPEMKTKCEAFFSQADNKGLTLIELGKQVGTPLESTYDTLLQYCEMYPEFNKDKFYEWIYNTKWNDKSTEETKEVLIAFFNQYQPNSLFDENVYNEWCTTNNKDNSYLVNLFEYFDLILPKNWRTNYYSYLAENNDNYKEELTLENLTEYVTGLSDFFFVQEEYDIYLEDKGTKEKDYSSKIEELNKFITNNEWPCYIFLLPDGMGEDDTLGSALFSLYSQLQNNTYFFINFNSKDLQNYSFSNVFNSVKNQKSAALFVNNAENSDLAALASGLFASYKFDLSDTNPASPFNYKAIKGVNKKSLTSPIRQRLVRDSVNFLDSITTQTVLMNGRYGDTYSIDYRYQWDLTSFTVAASLKQLILNGVNNPIYVIRYNQDGIDILKSRVKSVLNQMISQGCVTEYAEGIESATNQLVNVGEISAIDFRSYIRSNPEDYENEIYRGISFYLRIGKYIRQVIMNVTLG